MDPSPCGPGSIWTRALCIFPHGSEQRPWGFRSYFVQLDVDLLGCGPTLAELEAASQNRFCPEKTPCWFSWPRFPSGIPLSQSSHPTKQSAIWSTTDTCECLQCSSRRRSGIRPVASQFLCCRCNLQHWLSAGPALPGGFLSLCPFLGPCLCEWSLHLTRHQRTPSSMSTSTCPQMVLKFLLVDEEVEEALLESPWSASHRDGWTCRSWGTTSSWHAPWHTGLSTGPLFSACPCRDGPSSWHCSRHEWSHRGGWPRRTRGWSNHMCIWYFHWTPVGTDDCFVSAKQTTAALNDELGVKGNVVLLPGSRSRQLLSPDCVIPWVRRNEEIVRPSRSLRPATWDQPMLNNFLHSETVTAMVDDPWKSSHHLRH